MAYGVAWLVTALNTWVQTSGRFISEHCFIFHFALLSFRKSLDLFTLSCAQKCPRHFTYIHTHTYIYTYIHTRIHTYIHIHTYIDKRGFNIPIHTGIKYTYCSYESQSMCFISPPPARTRARTQTHNTAPPAVRE